MKRYIGALIAGCTIGLAAFYSNLDSDHWECGSQSQARADVPRLMLAAASGQQSPSPSPQVLATEIQKLVGMWAAIVGGVQTVLEIYPTGMLKYLGFPGSYKLLAPGKLLITTGLEGTLEYTYEISGNTLKLQAPLALPRYFTRLGGYPHQLRPPNLTVKSSSNHLKLLLAARRPLHSGGSRNEVVFQQDKKLDAGLSPA